MSDEGSDQKLVTRCLRGDPEAWEELFRCYFHRAECVASAPPFRFTPHETEEIAQETMIDLARKLGQIKNLSAYVGTVAHNKCVDRVRKMKPVLETDLAHGETDRPTLEQFAEIEKLPVELASDEALEFLFAMVDALGDLCRGVIHSRFFEELSYKQIAERSNIPAPQVGVNLARCLARLRAEIEKQPRLWQELESLLRG